MAVEGCSGPEERPGHLPALAALLGADELAVGSRGSNPRVGAGYKGDAMDMEKELATAAREPSGLIVRAIDGRTFFLSQKDVKRTAIPKKYHASRPRRDDRCGQPAAV